MKKIKIICSVGTRPEAIKMAPLVLCFRKERWCNVLLLATAQHREMLDQMLSFFNVRIDFDLNVMRQNQTFSDLTKRLLPRLDKIIRKESPDLILAQGDTTTTFLTGLCSFYNRIPFGHIEAGLRTYDKFYPYPEEMNRVLTTQLADFHFAPTEEARKNLLSGGVSRKKIWVTGNTVTDALRLIAKTDTKLPFKPHPSRRMVLVTAHRRENFGPPFLEICRAIREIVRVFPDIEIIYPVHPNPNIHDVAYKELGGIDRIRLLHPLDYDHFVVTMKSSTLILTDSGGIQEEATVIGKPVLLLRDETERPEAVAAGVVKVVGPHTDAIVKEASFLLSGKKTYRKVAKPVSPYGDGKAAERICSILRKRFAL